MSVPTWDAGIQVRGNQEALPTLLPAPGLPSNAATSAQMPGRPTLSSVFQAPLAPPRPRPPSAQSPLRLLWPTWAHRLQVPSGKAIESSIEQQKARDLGQAEDICCRPGAKVVPLRALALLLQQRQALAAKTEGHRRQNALWVGAGSGG